jgi:predicted small metal-binding protein
MAKMVDCGQVNPASGCGHVITGETEEEVLQRAAEHAKTEHGMEPTPEQMATEKEHIQDE